MISARILPRAVPALLLALGAALVVWGRDLDRRQERERAATGRAGRLLEESERAALGDVVGAAAVDAPPSPLRCTLRLRDGAGRSYLYVFRDPYWRVVDWHEAVAGGAAVEAFLRALLDAQGFAQRLEPDAPPGGAAGPEDAGRAERWTVELFAPGEDPAPGARPVAAIELLRALASPALERARRVGAPTWTLDADLHAHLARRDAQPPLLAPGIVPERAFADGRRLSAVEIESTSGMHYTVEIRERALGEDDMRRGLSPFQWFLKHDGSDDVLLPDRTAGAFVTYVLRAPYEDVLDAGTSVEDPRATLTLHIEPGPAILLRLGQAGGRGLVPLENTATGSVLLMDPRAATLLLPTPARLAQPDADPWRAALRSPR